MEFPNALSDIGERARRSWNTHPRLRVGSIIIAAWIVAIPAMRSAEQLFFVKWGSVGLLSIGVAFVMSGLASVAGTWRKTEWPDADDSSEWPEQPPSRPSPPPKDIEDGYEYGGTQTLPNVEFQGKSLSWALMLWWGALSLLFAIIIWRPEPTPFNLEGLAVLGFVGIVLVGMTLVHEGLHWLVARLYGADVSFGLAASGPYTEYTGVVLSRWQNILIIAAPLAVLTPASIVATLLANGLVVYVGVIVLLFHTAMSCGDLYQIGHKLYCEPGIRIYYPPNGPCHFYLPEGQSQQSLLARFDAAIAWVAAPFMIPPMKGGQDS